MRKKKKMEDGIIGYLTKSERYYCRKEVKDEDLMIFYYTLEGKRVPLAKAECLSCGEIVESLRCGDFQKCSCGGTAVDTDRWLPERHRYIGDNLKML